MKTLHPFYEAAEFLRESSASTNFETTLRKAVKVLSLFEIPHYVCARDFGVDAKVWDLYQQTWDQLHA